MAGIAGVTYKIMPSSPDVNLDEIKEKIEEVLTPKGANKMVFSEQPVAFGLKAIMFMFQWPEEKELEEVEEIISGIENIQSVQMTDIRKIA